VDAALYVALALGMLLYREPPAPAASG
jgi:hypothetical protein